MFNIGKAREAIVAGLVEKDGVFHKLHEGERVAIPLRLSVKKISAQTGTATSIYNLDNALDTGDDELINEDTLLSGDALKRPQQRKPSGF